MMLNIYQPNKQLGYYLWHDNNPVMWLHVDVHDFESV